MLKESEVNRREFLKSNLAAGFAAAVQPITRETVIVTDTRGLDVADVSIPAGDRDIPGYRARPAKGSGLPVVLVVHEIFGVHEHIKDLCRRLAKRGYLAVAPDLYFRQGDVKEMPDIQEIVARVASKAPDEQVLSDLDHAAEWASKTQGGAASRLGITGFCWGGRIVWLYAARNSNLKAAAAWYGRLVGAKDELHPRNPIDVAGSLKAPVLGLYGGKDQGIPVASVEEMRTALKAAGSPSEIVVYPDAGHAFNADYRPSYNKAAADDAWKRMLDWFQKYL